MQPIARRLGILLADRLLSAPGLPPEMIAVPVPLFAGKRRQRGFNQAERLAQSTVAALRRRRPEMRIALAGGVLLRQRATESQAGLSPHQRRINVRGAFFVSRPEAIAGQNILLIDDIYTTGATARACSSALRRAGANSIWVATVARAQWEFPPPLAATEILETARPCDSGASPAVPMGEDIAFWEEGRTVLTGGGTS